MPELPTARTKAERLFYERLQQLSAERRAIVLKAVGDPPDFDRIPLPIVLKLIEDQKFDAWKFYVLIYILAFTGMRREYGGLTEPLPDLADEDRRVLGPPDPTWREDDFDLDRPPAVEPAVRAEAEQWADQAAGTLADQIVRNTLEAARKAAAAEQRPDAAAILDAIDDVGIAPGKTDRYERIAITETTRGVTAGETGYRVRFAAATGTTFTAYWHTERDERVCPVCQPLNGLSDAQYLALGFAGPPAHWNCRCFLTYRVDRPAAVATVSPA